jgi:hypothetical protein
MLFGFTYVLVTVVEPVIILAGMVIGRYGKLADTWFIYLYFKVKTLPYW